MVKKIIIALIFSFFIVFTAQTQENPQLPENTVFAPFVSQLEGEIRNNLIRLSWKDAQDIRGPVYVYRSEVPFSALGILPVPAEIPYGAGSYLDEAENPGELHYFVVASDEWGRKYNLPIPNINIFTVTVSPENVPGYPNRLAQNIYDGSRQIPIPAVEGINVRIEDDRVIIGFSGTAGGRNLLLYRSLTPLRNREDLLSALIIRQYVRSPVIDYPLRGISYYYALVYEDELNSGVFGLRPGYNASEAVFIPGPDRRNSRDMPLPGLNFPAPINSFTGSVTGIPGGASTANPDRQNNRTGKKETEIFPEDLVKGGAGEEYQLRLIVQGYFSLKEWDKAGMELRSFLDLPRVNRAKARFYLGQVYYFQGRMREALFEFLSASDFYPSNCHFWIQAVLGDLSG